MSLQSTDTIAAAAGSPAGGGIAIVRISGPLALAVLHAVFVPGRAGASGLPKGQAAQGSYSHTADASPAALCATISGDADSFTGGLGNAGSHADGSRRSAPRTAGLDPAASRAVGSDFRFKPRYLHYGQVLGIDGLPVDEALAVYMPGPASATGEDVAEIHCHGGPGVVGAVLAAVFAAKARPAEPGEFTRRAFLNGKMDLTAAEAVAEIIQAPTLEGVRLAKAKLDGTLHRNIALLRAEIDALRAQAILAVDFPDEDAELLAPPAFRAGIHKAQKVIAELLAAFERATLWREGAVCLLSGTVNAGKSSLLNALLGRDRAIVSAVPGTTRDYIEETVNFGGLPVRLVDTAGLRPTGDLIEAEGMRLAEELADTAHLILLVVDAGKGLGPEEAAFLQRRPERLAEGRVLLIWNKIDTVEASAQVGLVATAPPEAPSAAGRPDGLPSADRLGTSPSVSLPDDLPCPALCVSAHTGQGLHELGQAVRAALLRTAPPAPGDLAPNLRQAGLLRRAGEELRLLDAALAGGLPPDILAVHLDTAADQLDEITGKSSSDDLLDRIFADFCIGK